MLKLESSLKLSIFTLLNVLRSHFPEQKVCMFVYIIYKIYPPPPHEARCFDTWQSPNLRIQTLLILRQVDFSPLLPKLRLDTANTLVFKSSFDKAHKIQGCWAQATSPSAVQDGHFRLNCYKQIEG